MFNTQFALENISLEFGFAGINFRIKYREVYEFF
jgi:hypothetical protein